MIFAGIRLTRVKKPRSIILTVIILKLISCFCDLELHMSQAPRLEQNSKSISEEITDFRNLRFAEFSTRSNHLKMKNLNLSRQLHLVYPESIDIDPRMILEILTLTVGLQCCH